MPRVTQTQTTETTVELAPTVQAQLEANLSTYNDLKVQAQLIADAMDVEKATIREIMEENSIESLKVGNQPLRMVRGVTSTLDKKKLLEQGVTQAMIDNATVTKPKKAYLDIRGVGEEAA